MFKIKLHYKDREYGDVYGEVLITKGYVVREYKGELVDIWFPEYNWSLSIKKEKLNEFLKYVREGVECIVIEVDKNNDWDTKIYGDRRC